MPTQQPFDSVGRIFLRLLGAAWFFALSGTAVGSDTPAPTAVTIAGSFQSELGCPDDWQPDCAATHLTFDAEDGVWQGTFSVPAGDWEYKAALNDSWDENYGANAHAQRAEHRALSLADRATVKFYYDHETHWVADNHGKTIAVAPGQLPERARLLRRLGSELPALLARRIPTATASTPSAPAVCRPATTRSRSPSTRAGTRTTARAASRTAPTSRSRFPSDCAETLFIYDPRPTS